MQIRSMTKKPANWKALAGVAAAGTIGLGGLALADPGRADIPPPITLTDLEAVTTSAPAESPAPTIIIPSDLDSPFETPDGIDDPLNSPEAESAVDDSPEASPEDPTGGDESPEGDGAPSPDDSPDGSGGS
jgi:hypothetical protein